MIQKKMHGEGRASLEFMKLFKVIAVPAPMAGISASLLSVR